MTAKYLIVGIDEVGRGPIAGPLTVGAFCATQSFVRRYRGILKDSKQLSSGAREKWYSEFVALRVLGKVSFVTCFIEASTIDRVGLSEALRRAIKRALLKLKQDPKTVRVLLDGGIYAPKEYIVQKTIIKGDEKEPVIAAASIVAKVERDRHMIKLAMKYPHYGFETHKGYGTAMHYRELKVHGLSPEHRRCFLKK